MRRCTKIDKYEVCFWRVRRIANVIGKFEGGKRQDECIGDVPCNQQVVEGEPLSVVQSQLSWLQGKCKWKSTKTKEQQRQN